MKIAITCENGQVFQHFGHTPGFALFNIEDGKATSLGMLSSGETGHGALAGLLADGQIDLLICGGIGGGAINALAEAGIQVIGGASGDVNQVASAFAADILEVNPDFRCHHHDNEPNHHCHGGGTCGGHCH